MKKEELLDKYIKYNSKITFDIFKLIYQKLIDLGFTSPYDVEDAFKEFSGNYPYFVIKLYNGKPSFNQHPDILIKQFEISVEDLLGYNPFESFKLPEKWYVKVTGDSINYPELAKWRGPWCHSGISYVKSDTYWTAKFPEDFIEITLEQFKQYVLKEPIMAKSSKPFPTHWCIELNKETIPIVGVYYNKKHLSDPKCDTYTGYGAIGCYVQSHNGKNEYVKNGYTSCSFYGEPSDSYPEITLEQFKEFVMNEPVKTETMETEKDWSKATEEELLEEAKRRYPVGTTFISAMNPEFTYEVISSEFYNWLDRGTDIVVNNSSGPSVYCRGKWAKIVSLPESKVENTIEYAECIEDLYGLKVGQIYEVRDKKIGIYRYPATQFKPSTKEAFEAQNKPKQPLKQAVHYETQEEWDFVTKKLNRNNEWEEDYPCQILVGTSDWKGRVQFCIAQGIQILSFQEWCDLNGYKMKKIICKKGDCYVVTKECPGRYGTLNFCYQALVDHTDAIYFETNSCISTQNTSVRPATLEEIKEYKRIGKPYDVTTLQSPTINTYGLNVGDTLNQDIICKWSGNAKNRYSSEETAQWAQSTSYFCGDRVIKSFKVIDNVVGFLVSGTLGIYLRAEGFKEFADNYYTETTSNFKVGSWYKYNGYYLKYSKTNDKNIFIASEYINIENNEFKDNLIDFTCGDADSSKELVTDLSVIQQYLPEGHPDKIVKNPIFEVGKWYKNLGTYKLNTYGKFLKLDNSNQFWVSEYIYQNEYSKDSGWFHCSSDTVECSLEEIQEFLPEEHPDKFIKSNAMGIKIEANSFYGSTFVQRFQFNKEEIYLLPDPD